MSTKSYGALTFVFKMFSSMMWFVILLLGLVLYTLYFMCPGTFDHQELRDLKRLITKR